MYRKPRDVLMLRSVRNFLIPFDRTEQDSCLKLRWALI